MLSDKNSTTLSNFEEEILYQISELRYHQHQIEESLKEAAYHLNKFKYHDQEINELTAKFDRQEAHV